MKSNHKNIAVLCGGSSSEREISILSGKGVYKAIIEFGYQSELIEFDDLNNLEELKNYDFVFIALHGFEGEGGLLQKKLDDLNIPYTGSNSEACKNTWNKKLTKEILEKNNIKTPMWLEIGKFSKTIVNHGLEVSPFERFRPFKYLFLKPQEDGSSVDIFKISDIQSLKNAYRECADHDRGFMFEEFIDGKEFTVTIINDVCYPPIEIITQNEFYDYDAKYISDDTILREPILSAAELEEIQKISIDAYKALNCSVWGRVDLMQCKNTRKFYVIEINTVPGMTEHSCVPKSGSMLGLSYGEIVKKIIDASI